MLSCAERGRQAVAKRKIDAEVTRLEEQVKQEPDDRELHRQLEDAVQRKQAMLMSMAQTMQINSAYAGNEKVLTAR